VDLRVFDSKIIRPEGLDDRPQLPVPKRWQPWAPLRRLVARLEQQPWFLPGFGVVFLLITLELLSTSRPLPFGVWSVLGLFLVVVFLVASLATYLWALQPREVRRPRSLLLIGTILLTVLVLTRLGQLTIAALHVSFPHIPLSAMQAALPIPLAGVLFTVLLNARMAFAGSLCLTLLAGLMLAAPMPYFLYGFVGSVVGIFAIARRRERTLFFRAGAAVALANTYTLTALTLVEGNPGTLFADAIGGVVNGAIVAVLATGLLPLLEHPFERTTPFTLLDLSNLDNPLLRYMVLTVPGTYHHSIMVGTLAEAAAEAVGANGLLCRVGAYYHDIGKTRHPTYFIENQSDAADRHTRLAPSLSRTIVMSHVKEGIELARAFGLPEVLVDLIPQHHGTRLVSFFFQRAKEAADPEIQAVKEEDYRYPGPKPQSREAAILMLADTVEASTRSLTDPTPARIRGVVQKVINNIFADGQLDECDLTLRDLHIIANSFVRILTGIFHHRIEYPNPPAQESPRKRSDDGDHPGKPAAEGPRRNGVAKKAGPGDPPRPEPVPGDVQRPLGG
jgi:putative nucleotidyltransferase with HDIG domain